MTPLPRIHAIQIAPSILACDFLHLEDELRSVEPYCDYLHMDVMDGHFVPNLTFGPELIRSIANRTTIPIDTHLMVNHPDNLIDLFVDTGSAIITIHYEALPSHHAITQVGEKLKSHRIKLGIALNPTTPISHILPIIDRLDHILLMSVFPGFCRQKFMRDVIPKITRLKACRESSQLNFTIAVDGGISTTNISEVRKAGCDIAVVGSALFREGNRAAYIKQLKKVSGGSSI